MLDQEVKVLKSNYYLLFALLLSTDALSQSRPNSSSIESVIDKLEKKLLEESGDRTMIYNARLRSRVSVDVNRTDIFDPNLNEVDSVSKIEAEVASIEDALSRVSDKIAETTQSILANANRDTTTKITINAEKMENFNLKKLEVSLNGFPLFKFDSAYNVNLPMRSIPIYDGPIATGKHKVIIKASFNRLTQDEVSIESEVYATANESLEIEILPQEKQSSFDLIFAPTENNSLSLTKAKQVQSTRDLSGEVDNRIDDAVKKSKFKSTTNENTNNKFDTPSYDPINDKSQQDTQSSPGSPKTEELKRFAESAEKNDPSDPQDKKLETNSTEEVPKIEN